MNEKITKGAWANAKFNGDFILVETFSGYTSSMRDSKGKQHFLAPDAGDEELGLAVQDATISAAQPSGIKRPYRDDSFILISAGKDGQYGTSDDLMNFTKEPQ